MMKNRLKTTLLLALLTVGLILLGGLVGGATGMYLFFFLSLLMNFGSYWFSDKIVLAIYRAKPLPQHDPVVEMTRRLAQRARLPMPKVYEIPTDSPNAFATGRNPQHAAVAVTKGIRSILSEQELEGVIAHELAHVQNRDTLISCIAASIAGAIMMLASVARWGAIFGSRDNRNSSGLELIVLSIIAPLAALIVQMAISRSREYLADATGAQITGSPSGLASALRKLDAVSRRIPLGNSPATAHLFIVNPFSGKNILHFFSTHPPVEERIKRLLTLQPMMAVGSQIA